MIQSDLGFKNITSITQCKEARVRTQGLLMKSYCSHRGETWGQWEGGQRWPYAGIMVKRDFTVLAGRLDEGCGGKRESRMTPRL